MPAPEGPPPTQPPTSPARPHDRRVWAIVGPTASGKSSTAMAAAEHAERLAVTGGRAVELVAIDAFTIYRGLDIASAKPSAADRETVPHHLLDRLAVTDEVSVAAFQGWARTAIAEVQARGHVPLLVGGSGLYFRAVVDDLQFPPTDDRVRADLEHTWVGDPRGAHAEVARRDPDAAARIEPDNLRRSVRALEVMRLTGRSFSSFRTAWDTYQSRYDLVVDYLEPPTAVLRERIAVRARRMVDAGLVEEVASLDRRGLSSTAAQGIGVAEALAVLDGDLHVDDLAAAVARRTSNYARRQRSWFRKDPRCRARRHDSGTALLAAHGITAEPAPDGGGTTPEHS